MDMVEHDYGKGLKILKLRVAAGGKFSVGRLKTAIYAIILLSPGKIVYLYRSAYLRNFWPLRCADRNRKIL